MQLDVAVLRCLEVCGRVGRLRALTLKNFLLSTAGWLPAMRNLRQLDMACFPRDSPPLQLADLRGLTRLRRLILFGSSVFFESATARLPTSIASLKLSVECFGELPRQVHAAGACMQQFK